MKIFKRVRKNNKTKANIETLPNFKNFNLK